MKFKILFFFVCAPVVLFGQQFLDVKLSSGLDFTEYPPRLNIEFGKNRWGIEAEAGYQFGKISTFVLDSNSNTPYSANYTTFKHEIQRFRWKLVGNYYPFRNRGAGQGLKLGVGIYDEFEVWRDPSYYETLETITPMPIARGKRKPFERLEYGIQIGYKRIFWKHLVTEASFMYTYRRLRFDNTSIVPESLYLNILIGYRFCFSSNE